jgi:hypothetical protein
VKETVQYNENGIPNLRTSTFLYEIYDIGNSVVGWSVGDVVDIRLVLVVNESLKREGKCLVKTHSRTCGRYAHNRQGKHWGFCENAKAIFCDGYNAPSCDDRHHS